MVAARKSGITEPHRLFSVLMVAFAACFVVIPIAPSWLAALLDSCVSGLVIVVFALLTMVGAYIARTIKLHPFVVFGFIYALYGIPRVFASFLVAGLADTEYLDGGVNSMIQATILMLVVVIASMSLARLSAGMPRLLDDLTPQVPDPVGVADRERGVEVVVARYGLTEREAEVMCLISRGRSKSFIAEALCISENTVKSHWKALYEKLGVHSKQEMLDLIDGAG